MSAPRRPTVLLPIGDGTSSEDSVLVEIPSTRRGSSFSISYADQRPGSSSRVSSSVAVPQNSILDSSDGDGDSLSSEEGEPEDEYEDRTRTLAGPSSATIKPRLAADTTSNQFQNLPQFSRTMSMPLPAQLSHLQHPMRQQTQTSRSTPVTPTIHSSPINSLSVELADSFQMVIQTMLQISPPQVLESAKEQYSACSLAVPTPSMSAMFTAMKTLNYMSANLPRFYNSESGSLSYSDGEAKTQNVFDIGELLQCVGDTLSGVAAQAGVDLVLNHGEVGLRHVYVKGDECGISYALLHIIRQILDKAQPGDLIELGLAIVHRGVQPETTNAVPEPEPADGRVTASPVDMDSLRCTIKIEHKYGSTLQSGTDDDHSVDRKTDGKLSDEQPSQPTSPLLRRLLRLVDAQFTIADNVQDGQTYEVSLLLDKAASPALKPPVSLSGSGVLDEPSGSDTEPSVEQLLAFCETLKGRKVTLYANTSSAFTRHITSYLAAWGMDINHVFSENSNETSIPGASKTAVLEARLSTPTNPVAPTPEAAPITASRPAASENQPQISFVLIDDDVGILREQLHALRVEQHPLNLNARARPSLAALHRPRSSPQIARVLEQSASTGPSSIVILHFTSLANFKAAKDVVQSVMSTHFGGTSPLPEVMIIPKPVGPRRFLTVMHTAVTRPPIDPFFTPTATSPGTPSVQASGSFFPAPPDPSSSNQTSQTTTPFNRAARPQGARSDSDRSAKEHTFVNLPSPSPLGMPDNVEYFPDPAGKLGPSSSSGFIVSSPDGQPAGIFFYPRTKKNASPQAAERIGSQSTIQRRGSVPRLFSGREGDAMSFSALHEASQPPDEATSAAGSPKIPASSTQDGTLTPGRRSPHESPGNESSPSRKAIVKRPAHEKQDSAGTGVQKRGNATTSADGNIVPPISVLIVDDNPINQTILSTFMKRKRIRYGIANNGKEAVEKWKNGGFHLILMDIQMPIMDGIEATREIRRLEALNATSGFPPLMPSQTQLDASIPVSVSTATNDLRPTSTSSPYRSSVIIVALTASSLQSDRVNALAAGCNDFLTKPVSLLWLNNKIIEWGSIKALQMWADIRPEAVRKLSRGQAAQARAIAARLRMPQSRNQPSKQLPISGMIVPPTTATTTSIPSTSSSHEARDGSGDNTPTIPNPTAENPGATPSNPPKRRRSQKRESAPESVKAKAVVALEDHDTPCVSMVRVNNGTPAVTGQDQDHPFIPKTEAEEPELTPGPDQASLVENPESTNVGPPPQSPVLGPR